MKTEELKTAYETGRGKLTLRARTQIEKGKNGRSLIVITEIPYQVNKAAMLEKILKVSEDKKAIFAGHLRYPRRERPHRHARYRGNPQRV